MTGLTRLPSVQDFRKDPTGARRRRRYLLPRTVTPGCDSHGVPSTVASRARADLLRNRIATVRAEHSRATARAWADGTELPQYSHLGALGLADHIPAMIAAQEVDRHLLAALEDLLLLIEQEQQQVTPT